MLVGCCLFECFGFGIGGLGVFWLLVCDTVVVYCLFGLDYWMLAGWLMLIWLLGVNSVVSFLRVFVVVFRLWRLQVCLFACCVLLLLLVGRFRLFGWLCCYFDGYNCGGLFACWLWLCLLLLWRWFDCGLICLEFVVIGTVAALAVALNVSFVCWL